MNRSIWKEPYVDFSILKKISKALGKTNIFPTIRIWSRRSLIIPSFVGYKFEIYNGVRFIPLLVTEEMIGHKFGEFAHTRKMCQHRNKDRGKLK